MTPITAGNAETNNSLEDISLEPNLKQNFSTLLEFNVNVAHIDVNPLVCDRTDDNGNYRIHTPDITVHLRPELSYRPGYVK
jgi:hypothetical protein